MRNLEIGVRTSTGWGTRIIDLDRVIRFEKLHAEIRTLDGSNFKKFVPKYYVVVEVPIGGKYIGECATYRIAEKDYKALVELLGKDKTLFIKAKSTVSAVKETKQGYVERKATDWTYSGINWYASIKEGKKWEGNV